jgi:hypothetical protein
VLTELLEEFNVCPRHLLKLAPGCWLDQLLLAILDLELNFELGLVCRLNDPVFGYALLDDFLVVTVALQEDLTLRGGDLEVSLVFWVEKEGDLADLTVKAILLDLELSIVLQIVLLQDHDRVSFLRDLGRAED